MGAELSTGADTETGKVELVIYDTEEDQTIIIYLDPAAAREQAYNLTVNAMMIEEGALPDDTLSVTDLELPE